MKIETPADFTTALAENPEKTIILKFGAEWCPPCRALDPLLNSIDNEREDIVVLSVDVDSSSELTSQFTVRNIPAVFIYKNGEQTDKFLGMQSKDYILGLVDKVETNEG